MVSHAKDGLAPNVGSAGAEVAAVGTSCLGPFILKKDQMIVPGRFQSQEDTRTPFWKEEGV